MDTKLISKREVYLDLAKFFAMIMMVAGHSFFELANPEFYNLNIFPWDWWSFIRGKTAPTFLFLSGAVHVFANFKGNIERIDNNVFKKRLIMSFVLLIIGYTLNSPINSLSEIYIISEKKLELFYQVNILHIFGIGLMILALIYRFAGSEKKVLLINIILSIFIIFSSPFIVKSNFESIPVFLANYLNYREGSIFTIFPYTAYMFLGTVFGILLRRRLKSDSNKNINPNQTISKYSKNLRIGLLILISGILLIFTGILITKIYLILGLKIDMRSDSGIVIRNTGIILMIIFLARQIKINNSKIITLISTLSKRALFIYVIHLFIIYGIGNIAGLKYYFGKIFEPPSGFAVSFLVIVSSIIITLLIDKSLKYDIFKKIYIFLFLVYSIIFLIQ